MTGLMITHITNGGHLDGITVQTLIVMYVARPIAGIG